ncbi:putative ubiquitinyl hydrolase 1 [Helianthus anomalus]
MALCDKDTCLFLNVLIFFHNLLGLNITLQFGLVITDDYDSFILADTEHRFNAKESDWGFTSFMPLSDLYDPGKGYLLNDTCIVEADVAVLEVDVKDSIPNLDGLSI